MSISRLAVISIGVMACCALSVRADMRPQTREPSNRPINVAPSATKSAGKTKARAANDESPTATSEQIAQWVTDLDDNRYLVRETATRKLLESGTAALELLLATANGGRPEPADRAVWIMRRLAMGKESAVRRQALEHLVQLRNRPRIAAEAHESLAEIRHNEAVDAIQSLGGRYVTSEFGTEMGMYLTPRVVLDQQWQGGDDGLKHLRHLVFVPQVIILGTDVSAAGLAHLRDVKRLQILMLYGTAVEPEDVPEIQKQLPQVTIDYRRGGLLGVRSNTPDGMGPAVVGSVEKGSAAEVAGIQAGDIIQKFQDQPVPNFKELTLMIAKYRAGDEVKLELLRNGQALTINAKLGAWHTIP